MDFTYSENFSYSQQKNPYHYKLESFSKFVMRDLEAENFKGKWNQLIFERPGKLQVEVGCGYGEFMIEHCQKNPDINFVGLDYRFKRSFNLAKKLEQINTGNFRYLRARGERLRFIFDESEVDDIFYFFPDPWPKKKHNKKRLFQMPFLEGAYHVLKPKGLFYIKTDHDDYALWMSKVLQDNPYFSIISTEQDLWASDKECFLKTFQTKFEKIFISKEIKIKTFVLQSKKEEPHGLG